MSTFAAAHARVQGGIVCSRFEPCTEPTMQVLDTNKAPRSLSQSVCLQAKHPVQLPGAYLVC